MVTKVPIPLLNVTRRNPKHLILKVVVDKVQADQFGATTVTDVDTEDFTSKNLRRM